MIRDPNAKPANWKPCEVCKKDVPASRMGRHIEKSHQMKLGLEKVEVDKLRLTKGQVEREY